MLDVATREDFLRWLAANHNDHVDQISQRPRAMREWVNDYARAMRSSAAELGPDPGYGGIFGGTQDGMGLRDPEGSDEGDY